MSKDGLDTCIHSMGFSSSVVMQDLRCFLAHSAEPDTGNISASRLMVGAGRQQCLSAGSPRAALQWPLSSESTLSGTRVYSADFF